jgi:hypothetical protein
VGLRFGCATAIGFSDGLAAAGRLVRFRDRFSTAIGLGRRLTTA